MAQIPVTNFGKATVSTTYDAAATSIVLTGGHGSRLPSTFPYPVTWWNTTDYPDPADDPNREIVTVTARATDTLTVTRGAESSGASTKNTGGKTYKMILGITKAMWDNVFTNTLSQYFRGLSLQTHPDNDLAPKAVQLLHADAIVMDDGQEVKAWDVLKADITVAGAGGLDTSSEVASTWYEIYAIYNGTTKNILLHRAKDYFLDEDSSAGEDASQGLRSAVDNSTVRVAQGFKVDTAGLLEFVDVKLLKTGAPTGNFWFTIEANSAGVPSNTPLATSDKYDVSRLTTTATWARLPFRTPASVSAATQYHLVMYGDFTVSATDYANWRMDGSAGAYANGSKALYDSDTTTWTTVADDDMMFKVYITRNDTAVTLPSGYTQKAKIGFVYNDSGSNFLPFRQYEHSWRYDPCYINGLAVNELAAAGTLYDLRAFIPPLSMLEVIVSLSGTGAGAAAAAFGSITDTDVVTSGVGTYAALYTAFTTENPSHQVAIPLLYSAIMADSTAGADLYIAGFNW